MHAPTWLKSKGQHFRRRMVNIFTVLFQKWELSENIIMDTCAFCFLGIVK